MIWNNKSLSQALGINIQNNITAGKLQFNSKDIQTGDLFIALKGGKADGHEYAVDAIKKGASAVIIAQDILNIDLNKVIKVNDTSNALLKLAKYKRKISNAKFIAITGSVGKTSTKEALKLMLPSHVTFASRGNFNNFLGLQINLASMQDDIRYGVFELGMNHEGEISELSKLLKPDVAIITNISEAHIEFFKNIDAIVKAKCEIFEGLNKSGTAIIPKYDKEIYVQIKKYATNFLFRGSNDTFKSNIYSFGSNDADALLSSYTQTSNSCNVKYNIRNNLGDSASDYEEISADLNLIPEFHCKNFTSCFLAVKALGLNLQNAAHSLSDYELLYGRGRILDVKIKNRKFKIICDHYNASPQSMKAALENFKSISHPNKTILIGDMLELGEKCENLHKELVPYILATGAKKILLVGEYVKDIIHHFPPKTIVFQFDNVEEIIHDLFLIFGNNELILMKASKKIGFEKILDYVDKNKI